MRHTCYCKIMKKLNALEKQVNSEHSVEGITQIIQEIRNELNANTEADKEVVERVNNIETVIDPEVQTATEGDIDNLFP